MDLSALIQPDLFYFMTVLSSSCFSFLPLLKKKNAVEAYPPPPCHTLPVVATVVVAVTDAAAAAVVDAVAASIVLAVALVAIVAPDFVPAVFVVAVPAVGIDKVTVVVAAVAAASLCFS